MPARFPVLLAAALAASWLIGGGPAAEDRPAAAAQPAQAAPSAAAPSAAAPAVPALAAPAPAAPAPAAPTLDDPQPAKLADQKQLAAEQPTPADQPPAAPDQPQEQPTPADQPPAQPADDRAAPEDPAPLPPDEPDPAPGDRFTMNVKDMELAELLQMIGTRYRVSIVCSADVAGRVSVNFYDVTLEEALDAILTVNNLTFTRRGKVIHIHKPVAAPAAAKKAARSFEPAWTDADTVLKVLTELKSETGKVVKADGIRDTVIAYDDPDTLERMAEVLAKLDRKPRQVLITTWVMELGDSDLRKLGMNWASLDSMKVFEYSGEVSSSKGRIDGGTAAYHDFHKPLATSVDLRAGILSDNQFSLLLSFFDTLSKSKVVSEPRVMTQENKPANIVVGTLVPIPLFDFAKESGTRILSGFQDQQIGTQVTVTPRVLQDGFISLEITPKVQAIIDYIVVNGEKQRPIVSTREAKTTVMVRSGDTVVIGGLRDESRSIQGSQVPFLGSLPILGWLFKNKTEDNRVTDLTIFIRPDLFDENNPLSLEEKAVFGSFKPANVAGAENGKTVK